MIGILNFILTLLILFIILSVIISIHELGHFIAAKKCGVYVEEFSLGMGPVIYQKKPKNSETTYSLRAFPIGGYVSMAEKEDPDRKEIDKTRILENKGFWQNLWVFANGIIHNFLLAIVIFFISGLIYGRPINIPLVGQVAEGSPAEKVGIEEGDKILAVNGIDTETLDDFLLEASAKKLQKKYIFKIQKKSGEVVEYNIKPEVSKDKETWKFGIGFKGTTYKKGFKEALIYGVKGFYDNFTTIINILKSLFTGKVGADSLSGPVGIYTLVDQVKSSFETILYLTAYLSINVGIVNLLPIPVFDGGRILILLIEKIIGHKTNEKVEIILNYVGFGLMLLLMLYVTFNDITRIVK